MTTFVSQEILGAMRPRSASMLLFVFVLVLLVCTSSIWLAPQGHGSFASVYGPRSSFTAKRAAGRVLSFIRTTLLVGLLPALTSRVNAVSELVLPRLDDQLVNCILTC